LIKKIVVPGFLGDFEVKNMNYTSDFESIAREALRVLLVIFVASYKNAPRALCRQTSALVEVRGDHIVAFRGLFWRQEAVPSAELT